jgi:hypothetical protein
MSNHAYRLAPWSSVVRPHRDVREGELDMGTYAVNLARVYRQAGGVPEVYARPDRFFATTYLTQGLAGLLRDVWGSLAGGGGDRVLQLRTPFGGGKTHTLVALLHLARDRGAAVAAMADLANLPDPGPVRIAVLSGEELDPLSVSKASGVQTRTLWGELAAQLGRYELVAEHDADGSAPGGERLAQVLGDEPVLVLLDEVLTYVEKAMAVPRGESTLGRQAMLFVQALTEVVNALPRAVMVYSLQASAGEAVGAEGLLSQLDHLVSRIDAKREPVTGDEVMRVVQRRLFEDLGDPAVRSEVSRSYADLVRRQLVAEAETDSGRREADFEAGRLEQRILAAYPFHPALLDLMYHRWGTLPSYQRTRGALQFLACVTHALLRGSDANALIGPGEVDLSDADTRGAFFSQVGERERYTAVLEGDIIAAGSGAKTVDRRIGSDAPALDRLNVGTRMATAVMLYSFGTPEGAEAKGVLETDLVAATLVPDLDRNVIVAALHDLREEELYLHYSGRRYRFEPKANLTKLVRDEANKYSADEVLDVVHDELQQQLRAARTPVAIWPAAPASVRDEVAAFTVAYLHPDWSDESQPLSSFIDQAQGGKRKFRNAVGLVLPDVGQFDRARAAARIRLATDGLLERRSMYGLIPEQIEELREKSLNARRDLSTAISRSYAQAAVPVRADTSSGATSYRTELVDLRTMLSAGRGLHDLVLEALSHRVFDRLTVTKLIDLSGLGPDRPVVACWELSDWFFSYFEFTKLTSAEAIAEAIAAGVGEGKLAYATGVTVSGSNVSVRSPELVRYRKTTPAEEIDLGEGAYILTAEEAALLTRPGETGGEAKSIDQGAGPQPPERSQPRPPSGQIIHHMALRLQLDGHGLFGLNRALSWLRDNSDSLDIEVAVRVAAEQSGIDPVRLRNGCLEPLEEGGAQITDQEMS